RDFVEFRDLAIKECLFEAVELTDGTENIVGICYIKDDEEPDSPGQQRVEFGGAFTTDECRGLGLATALGIIAISNRFAWDPPRGRLVGHVHEANPLPRGLLTTRLGFVLVGQEIPPAHVAPASMARNANGDVVGDLFEFRWDTLFRFADWIEAFEGKLEGPRGISTLDVALPLMTRHRRQAVT